MTYPIPSVNPIFPYIDLPTSVVHDLGSGEWAVPDWINNNFWQLRSGTPGPGLKLYNLGSPYKEVSENILANLVPSSGLLLGPACVDAQGNFYARVATLVSPTIVKISPSTLTTISSFGITTEFGHSDATHLCDFDTITAINAGSQEYIVVSHQTAGFGPPGEMTLLSVTGAIAWLTNWPTDEKASAGMCTGPSVTTGGVTTGKAYSIFWAGGPSSGNVGIYSMSGASNSSYSMTKIATFSPSGLHGTWTGIASIGAPVVDQTDGHLLFVASASNVSDIRLFKINSTTGAIIWSLSNSTLPIAPGNSPIPTSFSFVGDSVFGYIYASSGNFIQLVDTNAGALLSSYNIPVFGFGIGGGAAYNSTIAQLVVYCLTGIFSPRWATFGSQTDNTYFGNEIIQGCSRAIITGVINATTLQADVIYPFPTIPNDPFNTVVPIDANTWILQPPVQVLYGLDHLEGKQVMAVADGLVKGPYTVIDGAVTLDAAYYDIVIGLTYQGQVQTLALEAGEPTIQGKRKTTPSATFRLNNSRGLKVGTRFDNLVEIANQDVVSVAAPSLISEDVHKNLIGNWNLYGQICVQQDYPLPVTILAIIPEVAVGDTGK